MKLLNPNQNQSLQSQQTARDILRIEETRKLVMEWNRKLANAEADFNSSLAGQQARWAIEENDHQKRVAEMTTEINVLENSRKKALEPVVTLEERAKLLLSEAQDRMSEAKEKEYLNDQQAQLLEEKLDEVGEREQTVLQKERKVLSEQSGLEIQKQQVKASLDNLNKNVGEFIAFREASLKELKEKDNQIVMVQQSLDARKASLDSQEREIANEWIKIKDQRTTLERAFRRLSPYQQSANSLESR